MTESRLNLGCSNQILDGWVNVDCRQLTGVDKIQDLDNKHWDWPDGSVDEILMSHCLEHVKDPLAALRECRRVLKVDGKITIRVPHANGSLAYSPNHYSRFSVQWFLAFACSANDQIKLDDVWIEQKLKLHLFLLYRVANSAVETWDGWQVGIVRRLAQRWDAFWNATLRRQIAWEKIGLFPPSEITWTATKK